MKINKQAYGRSNNPKGLKCHKGNIKVKDGGIDEEFTQWELEEYIRCKNDVVYFIENYIVIEGEVGAEFFKLYDYQVRSINDILKNPFVIVLAPRRAGKSVCILGFILWFSLFNSSKISYVLSKTHNDSKKLMKKLKDMYESLPFFLQPGVKHYGIEEIEFSTKTKILTSSSKGVRGDDADILYCDEFAYLPNSKNFWGATYPLVAKRKNSRVIITSTPDGMGNEFYNQWENAIQRKSEFLPIRWYWDRVPGYSEEFKRKTISNIGLERWKIEFECEFLGSSNTLISGDVLSRLESIEPLRMTEKCSVYVEPLDGHKYIMCIDVADGIGKDYTVMTIIDITYKPYEIVAVYRDNKLSPFALDTLAVQWARRYNKAFIVIETNNRGADVSNRILNDHFYENLYIKDVTKPTGLGVYTDKNSKKRDCALLKSVVEEKVLNINDHTTLRELKTFQVDKRGSFSAATGNNDDTVMALVLFCHLMQDPIFIDIEGSDKSIEKTIAEIQSSKLPQEFLMQGFISGGNSEEDIFRGMMSMDNLYYRGSHFTDDDNYDNIRYFYQD